MHKYCGKMQRTVSLFNQPFAQIDHNKRTPYICIYDNNINDCLNLTIYAFFENSEGDTPCSFLKAVEK